MHKRGPVPIVLQTHTETNKICTQVVISVRRGWPVHGFVSGHIHYFCCGVTFYGLMPFLTETLLVLVASYDMRGHGGWILSPSHSGGPIILQTYVHNKFESLAGSRFPFSVFILSLSPQVPSELTVPEQLEIVWRKAQTSTRVCQPWETSFLHWLIYQWVKRKC